MAHDIITDIVSSLKGIERPLAALEHFVISDESTSIAAKDILKAGVAVAVTRCGDASSVISKSLTKWTKHSGTTKLAFRRRISVSVWNKERIPTLRIRLQSCVATVDFAVASTQLYDCYSFHLRYNLLTS